MSQYFLVYDLYVNILIWGICLILTYLIKYQENFGGFMKKLTFLLMAGFLVTVFSPAYAQLTPVTVTVSLDDNSQEEGDAGLAPFSVSINFSNNVNSDGLPSGLKVGVMVETTDGTATTSDNDYILQVSNKILTGPKTSASGVVALVGDTKFESDETLTYKVTNIIVQENGGWDPTFVLADDEALLTIENDDPEPPTFYINDKSNPENFGSPSWSMRHVAGLSAPAGVDAYYEYSTSDGSATSEGDCADYESKQNFIQKIPAGQTIRHATYTIFDDGSYEPNETVNVTVHRAWLDDGNDTPLQMTSSSAVGTINNDDAPPTISIQDKSKEEDFADELRFPVKLSEPTAWDVYFTWKSIDGSATGGDDFTTVASKITMIKGEKCRVYGHAVVEMLEDECLEEDETLQVMLTGAYVDDGQDTPLQITDDTADGAIENDDAAPVADFALEVSGDGIYGEKCVYFVNRSENADEYLWDFGDGTTSTEKEPFHCFYNPPHKYYDITLTAKCGDHEDTIVKKRFITVHAEPVVNFDAMPIVGPPSLEVQFTNRSGGGANHWMWEYGDGEYEELRHSVMEMENPAHTYMYEGEYTVGLTGYGNGGFDFKVFPNLIYVDSFSVALNLEDGSETYPEAGWDNAIDHDVLSPNATATGMNDGEAYATFSFADSTTKLLHKIRIAPRTICPYYENLRRKQQPRPLLTPALGDDTVVRFRWPRLIGSKTNLAKDFKVMVSMDGENFSEAFSGTLETKCDFETFEFDPVKAKYVKLMLLNARGENSPYVSIAEFQAFAKPAPARLQVIHNAADPAAR